MLAPTPAAVVFKRGCTDQGDWTSSAAHPCSDMVTSTDRAMLGGDADVNEVQLIRAAYRDFTELTDTDLVFLRVLRLTIVHLNAEHSALTL